MCLDPYTDTYPIDESIGDDLDLDGGAGLVLSDSFDSVVSHDPSIRTVPENCR